MTLQFSPERAWSFHREAVRQSQFHASRHNIDLSEFWAELAHMVEEKRDALTTRGFWIEISLLRAVDNTNNNTNPLEDK